MRKKYKSIWSREELLEAIAAYKAALLAVATGKSYRIGSRELTRLDLADIRSTLASLKKELEAIDGTAGPHFVVARPRS